MNHNSKFFRKYLPDPKPETVEIYARVPKDVREEVEQIRLKEGLSVYKIIEISLIRLIEEYHSQKKNAG